MASRSFHALFLRARDQYARSGRWTYLAVLLLAGLHGVVVTPFIEGSRLESRTRAERQRLAGVESGLGELRAALDAVREETASALAPDLEGLVADLGQDLARLDATRRRIRARREVEAGADADEAAGAETATPPPEAAANAGPAPFQLDDPDRIADLRDAETRDDLLAALAPLAEELIARPRWFDLERAWRDRARPRLERRLDTAAAAVPRLRGQFPEARTQWDALAGAVAALARDAGELRLEPPAAPFWWTVPAAGDEIELGLTPAVADEIRRPRPLQELAAAAEETLGRLSEVEGELRRIRGGVDEPADVGLLRARDLATTAPMFPLLVGLLLGAAVLWRSGRLRELSLTARLAIAHGSPPALARWLWGHVQWSSAAGRSATGAWRASVLQTLLGYFLAMAWITLAALQLRRLDTVDRDRLMLFAVAGAAAVLAAVAHRLVVARHAILAFDVGAEDDIGGEGEPGDEIAFEIDPTVDAGADATVALGVTADDSAPVGGQPLRR